MPENTTLRRPAALLAGGLITYVVVTLLHTGGPANDHHTIFDAYAHSQDWAAVHLGQFAGMALMIAGLIGLTSAEASTGAAALASRLSAVFAAIALGLYGVLQAVDGVALKHAVAAWVGAEPAEKAVRFASAETVRWLEWGTRSYQSYAFALALLLAGLAVALSRQLPVALGWIIALSSVPYVVQGWVLGVDGFDEDNTTAILAGYGVLLVWITWLSILAWRRPPRTSNDPAARQRITADN